MVKSEVSRDTEKLQAAPAMAGCRSAADAGFYFYSEYAYFGAYFFVSPHAERRADMT
jgi:hypothetical protein